jgi:transaldolase
MNIKIFADGANLNQIKKLNDIVDGYTFNPSLLRKSGILDFKEFAMQVLDKTNLPVSFEVFADNLEEMYREAKLISSWGRNVFVKIPPMTTKETKTYELMNSLSKDGIKINATCIFTINQIENVIKSLGDNNHENIISIFSGRIMDAGYPAENLIRYAKKYKYSNQKILWASTRELWNIKQAEDSGADIITLSVDLINKMNIIGKDLYEYSLDTIKMFRKDTVESGYKL